MAIGISFTWEFGETGGKAEGNHSGGYDCGGEFHVVEEGGGGGCVVGEDGGEG